MFTIRPARKEESFVISDLILKSDGGVLRWLVGDAKTLAWLMCGDETIFSYKNIIVVEAGVGGIVGVSFGYDSSTCFRSQLPTLKLLIRLIGWRRFGFLLFNLLRLSWKTRIGSNDFYVSNTYIIPECRNLGISLCIGRYWRSLYPDKKIVCDVLEENPWAERLHRSGCLLRRSWRFKGKTYLRFIKKL